MCSLAAELAGRLAAAELEPSLAVAVAGRLAAVEHAPRLAAGLACRLVAVELAPRLAAELAQAAVELVQACTSPADRACSTRLGPLTLRAQATNTPPHRILGNRGEES